MESRCNDIILPRPTRLVNKKNAHRLTWAMSVPLIGGQPMKRSEKNHEEGHWGLAPLWLFGEDPSPPPDVSSRNAGWLCPI